MTLSGASIGAIIACAPEGAPRRLARELVSILLSCASLDVPPSSDARACVFATRRMGGRLPLRAWRAGLMLRAIVGRGRPVTHDRGGYLCDDDTGGGAMRVR